MGNLLADLEPDEIAPAADALYRQRMEDLGKDEARMEFVLDQKGQVDHAIFRIVERDLKGIRK